MEHRSNDALRHADAVESLSLRDVQDFMARVKMNGPAVPDVIGYDPERSIGRDPFTGKATAFVYGNAERMRQVAEMLERIDASNPSDPTRRHWLEDRIESKILADPKRYERFKRERLGSWPTEEES